MKHRSFARQWTGRAAVVLAAGALASVGAAQAATVGNFAYGELQSPTLGAAGCGMNAAGEPAIHVSRAHTVFVGSEDGVGGGRQLWRGLRATGGAGVSPCGLTYQGQPNATGGAGASGGDIDIALASAKNATGNYTIYVASLNLASVSVATATDNGGTFSVTPVQAGLSPRVSTSTAQAIFPWLAATSRGVDLVYYGAPTKTNQTWSAYFAQNPSDSPRRAAKLIAGLPNN